MPAVSDSNKRRLDHDAVVDVSRQEHLSLAVGAGTCAEDSIGVALLERVSRERPQLGRRRHDPSEDRLALAVEQRHAVVVDGDRDAARRRPLPRRLRPVPLALVARASNMLSGALRIRVSTPAPAIAARTLWRRAASASGGNGGSGSAALAK